MASIRPAQLDDYDALCTVIAETDAFHSAALPRIFRRANGPARPKEWLATNLADPNCLLLVTEHAGQIVGFLYGLVREAPDTPLHVPRRYLLVDMLGLSEAHRGKGVGRALMHHAEQWARNQGITDVELSVWEFNEGARDFYDALGYITILRRMSKMLDDWPPV